MDPVEQQRRRELLLAPKMISLTRYVGKLRDQVSGKIPDFDPLDGGAEARVLMLLEKPGPQAAASGFVSRNNPDPTAKAIYEFSKAANIPRELSCLWNTIPAWNETTTLNATERNKGISYLGGLLGILPSLRAIILIGNNAQLAEKYIQNLKGPSFPIIKSAHPAMRVRNRYPEKWHQIPKEWEKVLNYL